MGQKRISSKTISKRDVKLWLREVLLFPMGIEDYVFQKIG